MVEFEQATELERGVLQAVQLPESTKNPEEQTMQRIPDVQVMQSAGQASQLVGLVTKKPLLQVRQLML